LYKKILISDFSFPFQVSSGLQDLLLNLLCRNPEERLTSREVLTDKYFADLLTQKVGAQDRDSSECLDFLDEWGSLSPSPLLEILKKSSLVLINVS